MPEATFSPAFVSTLHGLMKNSVPLAPAESPSLELALLTVADLARLDRPALERRCRALARSCYVGDQAALCRFLGRYKMYVSTLDVGFGPHLLLDGIWEVWLTQFLARRLKAGMRVVDAGANHGYYTVLMADIVGPTGHVAAFEPNPPIANLLRRTIAANGYGYWVSVHQDALVDKDDAQLLFLAPQDEPKNACIVDDTYQGRPATFTVAGHRLDTLLMDWPRIDFIKIDVEGAEEELVEGAMGLLKRDRPAMVLEFNSLRYSAPDALLNDLCAIYGEPRVIGYDSELAVVSRDVLLDRSRYDDWLLYFEA